MIILIMKTHFIKITLLNEKNFIEEYTPKLFSDEQNQVDVETKDVSEENATDQLFDQDTNEDEDFEIPAFLRRQKF